MSLLLSSVVMTTAVLGGYHLDGDAQGRASLGWTGWVGERKVVRVADLRDGRPGPVTQLWSGTGPTNVALDAFDVSPGGAAVACLRVSAGPTRPWRLQVVRRPPGGAWGRPIDVRAPKVTELVCGIDDAGRVTLAWGIGGPIRVADITADGREEGPVRLSRSSVDPPQLSVSAAGAATISYTVGHTHRTLYIAHARPGGWDTRPIAPAFLPKLAAGAVGWSTGDEADNRLRFAAAPDFVPQTLISEPRSTLEALVAGPRGDVLAAWQTNAWAYSSGPRALHVALQRPGGTFGPPVSLGHFDASPSEFSLAADGTGAVAFNHGSWSHPRLIVRGLRADGTWSPPTPLPGSDLRIVAAPGGRVTAIWMTQTRGNETLHAGLLQP